MSINCWGRRYPNASLEYFTGAIGRLPPYQWRIRASGFLAEAAVLNGIHFVSPASSFTTKVTDGDNAWIKAIPTPGFQFAWVIAIEKFNDEFTLRCTAEAIQTAGPPTQWWVHFSETNTTGWDWNVLRLFNLPGDFSTWRSDWGTSATAPFTQALYSMLPANFCSGV